ncbi:MAG: four helix bundle protein [Lysobacterales bacterium]
MVGEAKRETSIVNFGAGSFRPAHYDLELWKESMRLAVTVFRLTAEFPADEKFGISSQLRRSAISVPSNIAEGSARGSRAELRRFLLIARGSLSELDTQLWLAREVGLVEDIGPIQERMYKVFGLLNGLMKSPGSKV